MFFYAVLSSVARQWAHLCVKCLQGGDKTYTRSLILAAVWVQKKVALATPTSGIAATLLDNGRTVQKFLCWLVKTRHATFPNRTAQLHYSGKPHFWSLMKSKRVFATYVYEAIDRTLCDIKENDCMFGRLTVVFTGDWRQVMPVVHHGSRLDTADACVKKSYTYIWKNVIYIYMEKCTPTGNDWKW